MGKAGNPVGVGEFWGRVPEVGPSLRANPGQEDPTPLALGNGGSDSDVGAGSPESQRNSLEFGHSSGEPTAPKGLNEKAQGIALGSRGKGSSAPCRGATRPILPRPVHGTMRRGCAAGSRPFRACRESCAPCPRARSPWAISSGPLGAVAFGHYHGPRACGSTPLGTEGAGFRWEPLGSAINVILNGSGHLPGRRAPCRHATGTTAECTTLRSYCGHGRSKSGASFR